MKKLAFRTLTLFIIICLLSGSAQAAQLLIPVGELIGLQLTDGTVTVARLDETVTAAQQAGLQVGDRLLRINDTPVSCAEDILQALQRSDGTVHITLNRNGKQKKLTAHPAATASGPRLGIYLKEGITGVGTVSFYDPETGVFGALGHGVNDQNGKLLSMDSGNAYRASIVSVKKGRIGTPGQLMGSLNGEEKLGVLSKNTSQGVFGTAKGAFKGQSLPVGSQKDVKTGPATIRSCVNNDGVQEYSVEILKIYPNAGEKGRNMLLHVTDQALLATTGGIVQGMSGSPIIQDGKLVGAVTHVLVNDPTTGYGIFIENMLDAAA